jgi:hypothetical protein
MYYIPGMYINYGKFCYLVIQLYNYWFSFISLA